MCELRILFHKRRGTEMKKLWKTLTLICIILFISGCTKFKMGVEVIDVDTVNLTLNLLAEEEYMDLQESIYDENPFEYFIELFTYIDANIEEIEEEIDGDKYIGYEIIVKDSDPFDFIKLLEVDKKNGKEVYTLIVSLEDLFTGFDLGLQTEGLSIDEFDESTIRQMEYFGIEMVMSFTMPYNITEASNGDIKDRTLTVNLFELLSQGEDEIYIVANETSFISPNSILYIAGGITLVAAGAIAAIIINNKKKQIIPNNINNETIFEHEEPTPLTKELEATPEKSEGIKEDIEIPESKTEVESAIDLENITDENINNTEE